MSIIDIPLTNTYYNPHVSLTRDYVSPIKETAQFRNLESPQSGDSRSLSTYYGLKNQIESKFQQDLEKWRSKALDAEYRQDILEQENTKLVQELNYWKNKNYNSESGQALELELKSQLTRSQINNIQRNAGNHQELLYVEIDSLRNQLHDKMKEVDEQRKLYFDQEVRTQSTRNSIELKLKAYEQQLKTLLSDLQIKIDQAEELQKDNANLQITASKLGSIQREVKEVNSLLEYNYEESEKLRIDVGKTQSENDRLRKNELILKEQEQNLLYQIEQIQNKIRQTNSIKEIELQSADRSNIEILENLKQDHLRVKEALDLKKLTYSQLISEKERNVKNLGITLEEVKEKIERTRLRSNSAKKESEEWRQRHRSIDAERQQEVSRINREREKSIEAVKRNHNIDRTQLENRINSLRSDLDTKEELIKQSNMNLNRSRIEKNNLELERRQLQAQIEQRSRAEQEQERQQRIHLDAKERTYELAASQLRSSSQYEREKLKQQEQILSGVLTAKQREALDEKDRATRYYVGASEAEKKQRQLSIEADAWKATYSRTEREKSLDVDSVRSLRQSQIEEMKRSHNASIIEEERNKSALINVLNQKQNEVRNLLDTNNNLVGELVVTHQDTKRAAQEAQIWRTRAEIEERQRQQTLLNQNIDQQQQLDSLRRLKINENSYLRNQVNNLRDSIDIKASEEAAWKNNYSNLLNRR